MKKLLTILLVVCFCTSLYATGTLQLKATDTFIASHDVPDSAGTGYDSADSVNVTVTFQDGTVSLDSAWYNSADAQAVAINDALVFYDAWDDMNGADGVGTYSVYLRWYDGSSAALEFQETYIVQQTTESLEDVGNNAQEILDTLQTYDGAGRFQANTQDALDTLKNQDDWVAKEASLFDPTSDIVVADDTMSTGDSSGTKENQTSILAYFDTLIYVGPRGPGVYLDSAAGNTNTVLGTDGTSKNPVSTIAAAKTIATALGYNRYYFLNASTFNSAGTDIPSSHQNWEFIGIGNGNALAFGTQRVDESRFENMDLSGAMHASGGNVLYTNCTLGYITQNFNGHAFNCLLADTIVVKADVDIEFVRCQSDVGGNRTPTIDLSGGSSVVQVRAYSGGIRIMNGSSNDTISVETDGQVIIASNNTSLTITVRGMVTLTDNGTTTSLTKDAVFSRREAPSWVWTYDMGIWIDDGSGNTNTVAGVDGTRANPVATFAAARTLADALGYQKYYLVNNTSLTLAATHEDWEFIGIGEGNLIDFGSQDVDGSVFEHLMISGTQGGTGIVGLHDCYLNTIDSLEAVVTNSSYSDTISLRVSTNTVFDHCYSHIAGNTSPGLDFNSAGTIQVDFRHYSGGLTLFNGTSTHTISYESDGQLVIDASCTSINVSARGNMTITDNGTTTSLTDDAVFNKSGMADATWDEDSTGHYTSPNMAFVASRTAAGGDDTPSSWDVTDSAVFYGLVWSNAVDTSKLIDGDNYTPDVNLISILASAASATNLSEAFDGDDTPGGFITRVSETEHAYKVVATGSPTTIAIPLSYISPTPGDEVNDVFNGMIIMPITGNAAKQVRNIVDYTNADSTLSIRPGFTTACNSGDTLLILPSRMAVEPNPLSNHEIAVTATGAIKGDTLLRPPQTMVAEDTVTTGDTLAVKKDSLIYQGGASGLSAATIWQYEIRDDTTDGAVDDTSAADHLYSASLGGGGGTTPAAIWNYEGISDFEDSTGNDQAGQYLFSVGLHNVGQNAPTVHMKLGTAYDGTEGSNVSDDFDTTFAKLDAMGPGTGNRLCSLFVANGDGALGSGTVRMTSGATTYQVPISGDGFAVLNLFDATWTGLATSGRNTQDTIPQTFVVTAAFRDTITMTAFSPSSPSDTGRVVLYVWTDNILGDTLEGATFRVIPLDKGKNWVTGDNKIVLTGEATKKTNANGYAEIEVYQSSFVRPYPSGSDSLKYNISITFPGLSSWAQFRFAAPDSGDQYEIGVRE